MKESTQSKNPVKQLFDKFFIPNRNESQKQRTQKMINCIIAIVAVIAIVVGVVFLATRKKDENIDVSKPVTDPSSETPGKTPAEEPKDDRFDEKTGVLKKFSEKYLNNPEFAGHISIEGTLLDFDVAKGTDNAYYLDHTLDKKSDPYGTTFVDFQNVISPDGNSSVITMYGHSKEDDGTYCTAVKEYKSLDFYKKHPTIKFDTIYGEGEYKILGRFIEYVASDNTKMFNYHDYCRNSQTLTEKDFNDYVEKTIKRSYFTAPVDTQFGDEFIAISTCNVEIVNSNKTPYRDVLIARKVRQGESAEVDVSKATINKEMLMPDGWIKKFGKANPYK